MSKTVIVGLLATFFLASVPLADAQQPGKVPRLGVLFVRCTYTSSP